MITIYANFTGVALASGANLDAARAKLTALDCLPDTIFGGEPGDLTALDTGPHPIDYTGDGFAYLWKAREAFPVVPAHGPGRLVT